MDRNVKIIIVLLWVTVVVVLWGGLTLKEMERTRTSAAEIQLRYATETIAPIVVAGVFDILEAPELPEHYRPGGARHNHIPNLYYPFLLHVYWHALLDAGIGPLTSAPTGETWLAVLDRMLRHEGTLCAHGKCVLRPDCVGLGCVHIRNKDGTLDRGCCGFNDKWSADVPDAVAFNVVLAIRQVASDWGKWLYNGKKLNWNKGVRRWPGSWCGLKWDGGC